MLGMAKGKIEISGECVACYADDGMTGADC